MPREIERKFLITGDDWRGRVHGVAMRQGYLSLNPGCTVRVRIAGEAAFLTVKGKNTGASRLEFEYAVPVEDARHMLDALAERPLVEKTRYTIPFAGLVWEVDEFSGDNRGLLIAEVELEDENQLFAKPDWAGDEVTGDPRYYNANLVKTPFKDW